MLHAGTRRKLALTLALVTVALPVPALAAPAPAPSIDTELAKVNALTAQAETATEQYNAAVLALATAQHNLALAQQRAAAAQAKLAAERAKSQQIVDDLYMTSTGDANTDTLYAIADSSTPQAFLDKSSSLDGLAAVRNEQIAALENAQRAVDAAQRQAKADAAAAQQKAAQLAGKKAAAEALVAQETALLNSLEANEQARLVAEQANAAAAAAAVASVHDAPAPASGVAGAAIAAAMSRVGDAYVWGAAGPTTFDCSGLVQWAFGQVGIALPHYTGAQAQLGTRVPLDQLQPGDLVFFGGDLHHVGIYLGGGKMVHAPHTGAVVTVAPLYETPSLAVRIA